MRILITGTSGQLGTTLAAALVPQHEIIGIDQIAGTYTTHLGDLANPTFINAVAKKIDAVIHIASLHARHLHTHTKDEFIRTNIIGTQNLLDAAIATRVSRFVYTSTTSVYGDALIPTDRAVWVTESLTPKPRDIYDMTKLAAEQLCILAQREQNLNVCILRTGRFFPEPPDLTAIYRLYRGVDVRDVAQAHVHAVQHQTLPFGIYNIAAQSPFAESDTMELWGHADQVIGRYFPAASTTFGEHGWQIPTQIDRVYVIEQAVRELGYQPQHNFNSLI